MNFTEQRQRLRAILTGSKLISPADIYDPLSARIAQAVGYEVAMLTGAVASYTTLAAPDLSLITLTEIADQLRRITRVSRLSIIVDADHGYGNALNVMRTVQELEHAGLSAITLEDTALPASFGRTEGALELISIDEMVGKLSAAISGRTDPALMIVGRTSLRTKNPQDTLTRIKAYAGCGIDALFIVGLENADQLDAIRAETKLPIMLGPVPSSIKPDTLLERGIRILIGGHQPLTAAVQALTETYSYLLAGGDTAKLDSRLATAQQMKSLLSDDDYSARRHAYLR